MATRTFDDAEVMRKLCDIATEAVREARRSQDESAASRFLGRVRHDLYDVCSGLGLDLAPINIAFFNAERE